MNREAVRERYLQDTFPRRLAALAANLGRISSFSRRGQNLNLIKSLVEESEFFIEWTASEAPSVLQVDLVELQIRLAFWLRQLEQDGIELETLAREAQAWAENLLAVSEI